MNRSRIARYVAEALTLIRHRRFGVLRDKIQRLSAARSSAVSMAELETACASAGPLVWLIDGAQGGGAGAAAERSARGWRHRGYGTLTLQCDPLGQLLVSLHASDQSLESEPTVAGRISNWPLMPAAVARVEIHSLAGFTQPDRLATWLQRSISDLADSQIHVSLHWHDHYLICPTRHLLTPTHDYCGVPDIGECSGCLPQNPHCLDAPLRSMNMEIWRDLWGQLLARVSEICVFSPSSGELVKRCWPDHEGKIHLVPHDVSHIPLQSVSAESDDPLNIGVIGRIGIHKGAERVEALARYLADHRLPVHITILGTLERDVPAGVVFQTGIYSPPDLPALCAEKGVNVLWFPSIWPETFGFVLHEMRAMDLPILAYDVGAQADTLRSEGGGQVLPLDATPEDILGALHDLKEQAT